MLIVMVVCAEPKAGSQEDFELILKDYYNSVLLGKKPAAGRKKKIKKGGINDVNANESHENTKKYGAGFLAVCRGKVKFMFHIIRQLFFAS